jgi:type IV secretion system protein VirB4
MPYTLDGPYGQIFDADTDSLNDSFWLMIEMGTLMQLGDQVILPALSYLFHSLEKTLDGSPTLLLIDECWLFLSHPFFREKIREFLKVWRKHNGFVVLITQEINDAAESSILPTILSQTNAKIYLPDDKATTPVMIEHYKKFGLNETEILLLQRAIPRQDYFFKSAHGSRLFRLDLGQIALSLTTGQNHDFLDSLERNVPREDHLDKILDFHLNQSQAYTA